MHRTNEFFTPSDTICGMGRWMRSCLTQSVPIAPMMSFRKEESEQDARPGSAE